MSTQNGQREKFVFFLSYYEAIQTLDDKDKVLIYDSLCKYAFYGDVPKLPPQLTALFTLMKPYIDKSIRFSEKQKENRSKPNHSKNLQTSSHTTEREREREKEEEFDIEKEFDRWTV